jgi:hypothetical protein
LRRYSVGQVILGSLVYRRELGEIASRGVLGSVPYRSREAAAMWFIGAALPGWLLGYLTDVAAEAGDVEAVRLVGLMGIAGGIGGAALTPVSPMWLQVAICARIVADSRHIAAVERV